MTYFFKGSPNGVFHPDSSEICSICCNIALDTSPQSLHARFVARVLVWLSRGNLTITFPELSICDKSSTLSLINISYSFSDGELLSRTTFSGKCLRLVRFLITNDVLTSQHKRIAFAFACWNFFVGFKQMRQLYAYVAIINLLRVYFWILEQNQSYLFANARKHNSKGIFALWQFERSLRW